MFEKRKPGRPRLCPILINLIIQMRKEGYTYRAIARKLHISQMTVWRYLRSANLVKDRKK
ncbi:MAG: helix-turn-helix domain-containing protein [Methanosarcinales archaeon]